MLSRDFICALLHVNLHIILYILLVSIERRWGLRNQFVLILCCAIRAMAAEFKFGYVLWLLKCFRGKLS